MASQDIIIGIKTQFEGDMGKTLDQLDSKVKGVTKSVDKLGDAEEKTGEQSKKSAKSFKSQANEVAKGIGIYKAADAALGVLKDALMSNAVVGDALKGFYEGFMIILGEVVGAVVSSITEAWDPLSRIFSNLYKIGRSYLNLVLVPFKPAFYALTVALKTFQLAWEMSPFGSGDTKTIDKLKKEIVEVGEKLLNIPKNVVDSYKAIGEAAVDIYKDSGKVADVVMKNFDKIDLKKSLQRGKDIVALEKAVKFSDEISKREIANLETQAEQKRQIRDDDTSSIKDRIKANEELAVILENEKTIAIANAELQLKAAQARANATKKDDDRLKVQQALTALAQVQTDIEGKISEQKQNKVALGKEEVAIEESRISNVIELGVKEQQNTTARIKDEQKRLEQVKLDLQDEKLVTLTNLDDKIKATKENTQARVDAEKEYRAKKIEIDNQIAQTDDQINQVKLDKTKSRLERELQATIDSEKEKASEITAGSPARLEAEGNILQMQLDYYTIHKSQLFKTDEEYAIKKGELEKQITDNDKAEQEARKQNAFAVTQEILSNLSNLASNIGTLKDNENKAELTRLQDENNAVLQSEADKVNAVAAGTEDRKKAELKYSKIKEGLDKKLEEQKKKLDKDSFERGKKIAISTALINGSQAIIAALATPDPTLGIISAVRVAAAVATTAIQVAAIRAQSFDGGSTTPSISGDAGSGGSDAASQATSSAPSTIGLGSVNIMDRKQKLEFQKVYVVESDIRNVTGRVEVIENRSVLGS